jgi:hypothetical protein
MAMKLYREGKTEMLKIQTSPSATVSTKNPTSHSLELNPGLCGGRRATNILNHRIYCCYLLLPYTAAANYRLPTYSGIVARVCHHL